ncbi:hypothetical protein F4779DRAFT_609760 [Xylariaceae sp. FL0662B]|nr:hypothetical protein F4779DRAFT_609760 [Xylariaceae sp. FL0662B]
MNNSHSPTLQTFPFLLLPYHIRDDIYSLVLAYPDLEPVFGRFEASLRKTAEQQEKTRQPKCTFPVPKASAGTLHTPPLLLVNRQITAEALQALRDKPFVLTRYAPYSAMLAQPMDITEFISEYTLRSTYHVVLKIDLFGDARAWCKTVEVLLDTWVAGNCLRKIEVWVHGRTVEGVPVQWEKGFEKWALMALSKIRNFAEAEGIPLMGNLPESRLTKKAR